MVLDGTTRCYMVLHGIAPISYSIIQQMSPVIAFDIAVVAQKVKVHVVIEDRCDLKKWVVVVYH